MTLIGIFSLIIFRAHSQRNFHSSALRYPKFFWKLFFFLFYQCFRLGAFFSCIRQSGRFRKRRYTGNCRTWSDNFGTELQRFTCLWIEINQKMSIWWRSSFLITIPKEPIWSILFSGKFLRKNHQKPVNSFHVFDFPCLGNCIHERSADTDITREETSSNFFREQWWMIKTTGTAVLLEFRGFGTVRVFDINDPVEEIP